VDIEKKPGGREVQNKTTRKNLGKKRNVRGSGRDNQKSHQEEERKLKNYFQRPKGTTTSVEILFRGKRKKWGKK